MSLTEQTVKCPCCGRPYKFYPFSAADQSACPRCVAEAEQDLYTVSYAGTGTPPDFLVRRKDSAVKG